MDLTIRGVSVVVHVDATRATYAEIAETDKEYCQCAYCQNFRALGTSAFPQDILDFFSRASIPIGCFAEVYEFHETRPGYHLYGGEYYFWGKAPFAGNTACDFSFEFMPVSPLVQDQFFKDDAVCFNFLVELPWVITDTS